MVTRKFKVAVVENDSALRRAVGRLLSASGHEVALFSSAENFLEDDHEQVDCLLLDIDLDGMSGLELQKKLCNEGDAPPIIFMTGQGDVSSIGQAVDNGCIAYLHKPFEAHSLFSAIKSAQNVN